MKYEQSSVKPFSKKKHTKPVLGDDGILQMTCLRCNSVRNRVIYKRNNYNYSDVIWWTSCKCVSENKKPKESDIKKKQNKKSSRINYDVIEKILSSDKQI